MSADLPHSFARVSSNNMVINLDPPQQKTSHQQAHKYNDRCPLQPANLSLGSTHFVALLIKQAAVEKKTTNETTSRQLSVTSMATSGQLSVGNLKHCGLGSFI